MFVCLFVLKSAKKCFRVEEIQKQKKLYSLHRRIDGERGVSDVNYTRVVTIPPELSAGVPLSASLVVEFGGVAHGGAVSVANADGSDEQLVAVHYGAMMPFSADISSHRCVAVGVCTLRVVACVTPPHPTSVNSICQISSHLLFSVSVCAQRVVASSGRDHTALCFYIATRENLSKSLVENV
jgi:hypothetical protein